MSEIRITLDPVALREATSQAIMGVLTPEVKEKMISEAIRGLLTPSTGYGHNNRSVVQMAFDDAVQKVARQVVEESIAKDERVKEMVTQLITMAREKLVIVEQDKLVDKIADAFVSAIKSTVKDRY